MNFDNDVLDNLAEAAHEVFCEHLRAEGYEKYAPETDKYEKVHSSLRPYSELPEGEKEQDRSYVRDILNKLNSIGYTIGPALERNATSGFSDNDIERLAEMEHRRWMREKLENGWKYAEETNKAKKLHQCLLPWDQLPEDEREKDRAMIRGIPRVLSRAGHVIVRKPMID